VIIFTRSTTFWADDINKRWKENPNENEYRGEEHHCYVKCDETAELHDNQPHPE
jgi:hypothetical protein